MFQPLAADEAVFAGQPIAIVVAESETAAADGAEAVVVDATPLPTALDPEAAMVPDAPVARPRPAAADGEGIRNIHSGVGGSDDTSLDALPLSPNVIGRNHHQRGDIDAAMDGSDLVVRRRFETPWVYQAYLEPHVATAIPTPDGGLEVACSTQGTLYTRSQLAKIFGLPMSRITVRGTALGGGFGSKVVVAEPLAVGAALGARPSRAAGHDPVGGPPGHEPRARRACWRWRRAPGATAPSRASGAGSCSTAGAFSEWSIESIAAVLLTGPYRWDALDIRAFGVETNRVGTGSYRGPGGPQASFAIETRPRRDRARPWASTPSSCAAATWSPPTTGWRTASIGRCWARLPSSMRSPRTRPGRGVGRCPRARGSAWPWGCGRGPVRRRR